MSSNEPTLRVNCPRCRTSFLAQMNTIAICPTCKYNWRPHNAFMDDWNFNKALQPAADSLYSSLWELNTIHRNLGNLDKERGIDVRLELVSGLTLDIQEKYRRADYRRFWEFTVEYQNNPRTGERGEFYKLCANYYFYAYVSEDNRYFTDWWIVDLNQFKDAYSKGVLKYDSILENKARSHATALCFKWGNIEPYIFTSSASLKKHSQLELGI